MKSFAEIFVGFKMSRRMEKSVSRLADARGVSRSAVIREALRDYLAKRRAQTQTQVVEEELDRGRAIS